MPSLFSFLELNCGRYQCAPNTFPESPAKANLSEERTQNNPHLANAKRKSNLELAGKSIRKARLGNRAKILKIILPG